MESRNRQVTIIGGGIGGLTLALFLHERGVPCRIFEAAAEIRPLGVGLNLLPHAVDHLHRLGLEGALLERAIETEAYSYFTRHGQLVCSEPRGRFAGYDRPQISIHRGDLHLTLIEAVRQRLGSGALVLGHRCVDVEQDGSGVTTSFVGPNGESLPSQRGAVAIACDGIHSVARQKYHPEEARLRYEGTTQYRGTTRAAPFLGGATMVYLGTIEFGKLVIYPIRNAIDGAGNQLINWVVEIERPADQLSRDWNRPSDVAPFIAQFEHARFPWLDIAATLRAADAVFEYPMVDQDPLSFWTSGRVTLLGDAAHPMMPRGSNGSAQAIIDAAVLSELLARSDNWPGALMDYEAQRHKATSDIVIANRTLSPDAILQVVEERSGGAPFNDVADLISAQEFEDWQARYRRIAGFEKKQAAR